MVGRARVGIAVRGLAVAAVIAVLASGCRGASWGYNALGQVGDGTTTDRNAPTEQPDSAWLAVTAGGEHSCGIRPNRTAWCWGSNSHRQLGVPSVASSASPVPVVGGTTSWASISAGARHTCAIRTDATLWCWGRSTEGQLGNGVQGGSIHTPTQVPGSGWATVGAAYFHTCATRTDGSAWCWGENLYGQVGDGTDATYRASPAQVAGTDWISVSGGSNHSCGLRTDGSAWCWGLGDDGFFGPQGWGYTTSPVQVAGSWAAFESGLRHVCGITADHGLSCWGNNQSGELGLGFVSGYNDPVTVPGQVPGDDWLAVSAGATTTCALRLDRTAWCWGENGSGALGDGTNDDSSSPVAVVGGQTWSELSVGHGHVAAVRMPVTSAAGSGPERPGG